MSNVDRSWGEGWGGERACEELHRSSKSASCELSVGDVTVGERVRIFCIAVGGGLFAPAIWRIAAEPLE